MEDAKITPNQVGCHFLDFAVHFFTLSKGHFRQQNLVKANSLAFNTLVTLNELADACLTMSDLAARLEITKQQLTKLVNDLEEKDLVNRIHNPQNRRQVYIRITDHGCALLKTLREEMLCGTVSALSVYTPEELAEMDYCLCRLDELLGKFDNWKPSAAEQS